MIDLTSDVEQELLTAMDKYKAIAEELIDKLITETDQPEKKKLTQDTITKYKMLIF
ncbi:hypothetical protein [Acinetobacter bereziniae]|uniref:hypothetical protein n=1 Tax=Acinetobacter bereziniae TaxID=106648 RepID=UPI0030180B1F